MDSKIGLIIQLAGVSLITLLTLFLRRSIQTAALKHWTNAWLFLCVGLFSLRLAFSFDSYSTQLFSLYFFSEYMFGLLLVCGCRSLAGNGEMRLRQELFVIPFIVIAFALPLIADDFNLIFNAHAFLLSGFFLMAVVAMWRSTLRTFGWKVMMVALSLLIVDFLQYFVVFTLRQYVDIRTDYLSYNSVVDLVLQTLLGFGMVIVLLELVLSDAKQAHEKLKRAHERLEELAHIDPLTTALNRHAFYGYVQRQNGAGRQVHGCVGFFDIDDLKVVNDAYGHAVGDDVIRAVVRAIRELVRAEDLVFRWGGDEFFVLMIGMDIDAANDRMSRIGSLLTNVDLKGLDTPVSINVSHAFAPFDDLASIEIAIEKADAGMYRNKQERKIGKHIPAQVLSLPEFASR